MKKRLLKLVTGALAMSMVLSTAVCAAPKTYKATKMKAPIEGSNQVYTYKDHLTISADQNGVDVYLNDYSVKNKDYKSLVHYDQGGNRTKTNYPKTMFADNKPIKYGNQWVTYSFDKFTTYDEKGTKIKDYDIRNFVDKYLPRRGVDCSGYMKIYPVGISDSGKLGFTCAGMTSKKLSSCYTTIDLKTGKIDKKNIKYFDFFIFEVGQSHLYGISMDEENQKYVLHRYNLKTGVTESFSPGNIKLPEKWDHNNLFDFSVNKGNFAYHNNQKVYIGNFKTKKMKKAADLSKDKYYNGKKMKVQDIAVVSDKKFYVLYTKQKEKSNGVHETKKELSVVKYTR